MSITIDAILRFSSEELKCILEHVITPGPIDDVFRQYLEVLYHYARIKQLSEEDIAVICDGDLDCALSSKAVVTHKHLSRFVIAKRQRLKKLCELKEAEKKMPPVYREFVHRLGTLSAYIFAMSPVCEDEEFSKVSSTLIRAAEDTQYRMDSVDRYKGTGMTHSILEATPIIDDILKVYVHVAESTHELNQRLIECGIEPTMKPLNMLLMQDQNMEVMINKTPPSLEYLDPELILNDLYGHAALDKFCYDKQLYAFYLYSIYELAKIVKSPRLPNFRDLLKRAGYLSLIVRPSIPRVVKGGDAMMKLVNDFVGNERQIAISRLLLL